AVSGETAASVRYVGGNSKCAGVSGAAATRRAPLWGIGTCWAASNCTRWPLGTRLTFPLRSRINGPAPSGSLPGLNSRGGCSAAGTVSSPEHGPPTGSLLAAGVVLVCGNLDHLEGPGSLWRRAVVPTLPRSASPEGD